jgi:hypothetical protein
LLPDLKHRTDLCRIVSCIFCCLIFLILPAQKQTSADQQKKISSAGVKKVEAIEKASLRISAADLDSAVLLAKQALLLSKLYKNDTCFALAYLAVGWCHYYNGNRDSAEYFLLLAVSLFHRNKMFTNEGRTLINLSYVYQESEEYIKLIDCLKKARPLIENDESVVCALDLTMGSTYGDMQMYDEGKRYIFSAIATTKKLGQTDFLSSCFSAMGYLFMQQENFDSALYYYRNSYAVSIQLQDIESMAVAADNLGEAFHKKYLASNCAGCIDSSYHYYKLALQWYDEMNSNGNTEYAKMNLGSILIDKKNYNLAEVYLTGALHYFDSLNDIKYVYTSSQLLSKLYYKTGNYKKAYDYQIAVLEYKDSLDRKKRADSIASMFAFYET